MNKIQSYINQIFQLIAKDQIKDAIHTAQNLLIGSPQFYELTLQSARYCDIIKSIRTGAIDFNTASIEKNKLRKALIDMLRDLEESATESSTIQTEVESYLKKIETTFCNTSSITGNNNFNIQGVSRSQVNIQIGSNKNNSEE